MNATCDTIQASVGWCDSGAPSFAGTQKRIYYIAKSDIAKWPELERNESGRAISAKLVGSFELVADKKWRYIDTLPDKSQLSSDSQGEHPSQTQLNKLSAVHPGVGEQSSALSAYANNADLVFLVQDMADNWRVVGSRKWNTKTTVSQDNGQGAAGTTSTTISVEASDEVVSPFYHGTIDTEDGVINQPAA